MVVDFALPYISRGETLAERKNRLTLACVAWNYSCVPEHVGLEHLGNYMGEYRKWNSDATDEECLAKKRELELLMKEKRKKYPNVLLQIVFSELESGVDEERIVVAFTSQEI